MYEIVDVLNPPIVEVGGSFYRLNNCHYSINSSSNKPYIENAEFDDEPECMNTVNCEHDNDNDNVLENIQITSKKEYKYEFHVPDVLRHAIIGPKGRTLQSLEAETNTRIIVPRLGHRGDVVILSRTELGIITAHNRIKAIVDKARSKKKFTHFLSIPVQAIEIKERFKIFKKEVLENCINEIGICEELFQIPEKLHATIGILTLLDSNDRTLAIKTLQECAERLIPSIVNNKPHKVHIQGIDYMNDDPSSINVLYAKIVDDSGILQTLVDGIARFFAEKNVMNLEQDHIKLHVTLMNTAFVDRCEGSPSRSYDGKKRKFDASKILQEFGHFDFGELVVNSVHLSQRSAIAPDGYYLPSRIVKFP